jgi:photosystem II stability/assembly factor-like uncharacterized protein
MTENYEMDPELRRIDEMVRRAAAEPGDEALVGRGRGRVTVARGARRPRRMWVMGLAAAVIPTAAAAALALVIFGGLRPQSVRQVAPGASPSAEASALPSPASPVPAESPSPSPTAAPGPAAPLTSVRMLDSRSGWATTGLAGHNNLRILWTADGGVSWVDRSPANQLQGYLTTGLRISGTAAVFTLDARNAWVADVGDPLGGTAPTDTIVYSTADGGVNWTNGTSFTTNGYPGSMSFVDTVHGWIGVIGGGAAGSNEYTVYRSVDGGMHWAQIAHGQPGETNDTAAGHLPSRCDKAAVSFVSATTGWLTGSCAGGDPVFYVTHDGGSTWRVQHLPIPNVTPGYIQDCNGEVTAPTFTTSRDGWLRMSCVVESGPRDILYVTHDAGSTWAAHNLPEDYANILTGAGINYWFAGNSGPGGAPPVRVMHSHDDGVTWQDFTPAFDFRNMISLTFVDSGNGWASVIKTRDANDNVMTTDLFRTTDGGKTWSRLRYTTR